MSAAPRLSPELALLVTCDLGDDAALYTRLHGLSAGFDWNRFGDLVFAHGMASLVLSRCEAIAPAILPPPLARELNDCRRNELVMSLTQAEATAKLVAALNAAGIEALVLKGTALASLLYAPHPEWRNAMDIDILIAPEDREAAEAVLLQTGLVRTAPVNGVPQRGGDLFLLLENAFDYVFPHSRQLVELHHRICRNPSWLPYSFGALVKQSRVIETAHGPIRGLDGPVLVSYLCWHAVAHFGYRLKWFGDIARALRQFEAGSCMAYCATHGTAGKRHLALVDQVLAVISPAVEVTGVAPKGLRISRRAAKILADLESPTDVPTRRSWALIPAEIIYRGFLARISPGWRGKAFEVMRAVVDPRDVELLGLGRRFVPGYVLLGPLLALRRYFRARLPGSGTVHPAGDLPQSPDCARARATEQRTTG